MNMFITPKDQIEAIEKIYFEARDGYSLNKDPLYLRIQLDCIRQIKIINRELQGLN